MNWIFANLFNQVSKNQQFDVAQASHVEINTTNQVDNVNIGEIQTPDVQYEHTVDEIIASNVSSQMTDKDAHGNQHDNQVSSALNSNEANITVSFNSLDLPLPMTSNKSGSMHETVWAFHQQYSVLIGSDLKCFFLNSSNQITPNGIVNDSTQVVSKTLNIPQQISSVQISSVSKETVSVVDSNQMSALDSNEANISVIFNNSKVPLPMTSKLSDSMCEMVCLFH